MHGQLMQFSVAAIELRAASYAVTRFRQLDSQSRQQAVHTWSACHIGQKSASAGTQNPHVSNCSGFQCNKQASTRSAYYHQPRLVSCLLSADIT